MTSATLTEQQLHLIKQIPNALGGDPTQKDWAPVMSGAVWSFLRSFPEGLVETHQRHCPIIGNVLGVGFVRLTDAGRAALSAATGTGA